MERVDSGRRLLVVEKRKVTLVKVWNVVTMPVGHGKDQAHLVYVSDDGRRAHIARRTILVRLRRLCCRARGRLPARGLRGKAGDGSRGKKHCRKRDQEST